MEPAFATDDKDAGLAAQRTLVLTKAVLRAAERLGLTSRALGRVLGLSEPTVSRMRRGGYHLDEGTKSFELAALVVRVYRSLDAVAGGDAKVVRAWMDSVNLALGGTPAERILTVQGLVDVVAYLDARRASV